MNPASVRICGEGVRGRGISRSKSHQNIVNFEASPSQKIQNQKSNFGKQYLELLSCKKKSVFLIHTRNGFSMFLKVH